MNKLKYYIKRFGTDVAGYGLILLGILTGWLPGPGGIPLILAGLGLLSIHNHWARKLLVFAKEHGSRFMQYIFPEHPIAKAIHDIIALVFVCTAAYIVFNHNSVAQLGIAVSLTAMAVVDFLYNRKRWIKVKQRIKQR